MTTAATPMPPHPAPADRGLGSLRGIRWLLLAGGLITSVSVFRLGQLNWDLLSLPLQFLLLAGAGLAVFAAGEICRRRLALPLAGNALLALFAVLIPVLSWGAGYVALLATTGGVLAFAAAMTALNLAAVRALHHTLRYRGRLYPAALALLSIAPPLVARLAPASSAAILAVILGPGAMLEIASRHINRFLFHRDRKNGRDGDHPIELLPFLVLTTLYAAAVASLPAIATWLALPLAITGAVLAGAGEEYVQALAAATGRRPSPWPLRSVGLLALGFAALVAAFPLALLDPSRQCLALVGIVVARVLLGLVRDHRSVSAHTAGVVSLLVGFHFLPALARETAAALGLKLATAAGIPADTPAIWAFWHVLFTGVLAAIAVRLRRRGGTEAIRHSLALFTGLHLLGVTALALHDHRTALFFLPIGLAAAIASVFATRRNELVEAAQFVAAAFVLVLGGAALGQDAPFAAPALRLLGVVATLGLWLGRGLERRLLGWLDLDPGTTRPALASALARIRRSLVVPALCIAAGIAFSGILALSHGDAVAGIDLVLAAAVTIAAGIRLGNSIVVAVGVGPLALGLHALPCRLGEDAYPILAAISLSLLALSWLVDRLSASALSDARSAALLRPAATLGIALHAMLGAGWLLGAFARQSFTIEPLVIALVGLGLAEWGFRTRAKLGTDVGIAALVAWTPLQLWTAGHIQSLPAAALVGAVVLTAITAGLDRISRRIPDRERSILLCRSPRAILARFLPLAALVAIVYCGTASLLLALAITALPRLLPAPDPDAARCRVRLHLQLLPILLVQSAAALFGTTSGYLAPDLARAWPTAVAPIASLALLYTLVVDRVRARSGEPALLRRLLEVLEVGTLAFFVHAFVTARSAGNGHDLLLVAVAIGFAARRIHLELGGAGERGAGWRLQAWLGAALLQGVTAGWIRLDTGLAPYGLLAAAAAEHAFGRFLGRKGNAEALAGPAVWLARALPVAAGMLALSRSAVLHGPAPLSLWFHVLPAFLASLAYLLLAARTEDRTVPALLATGLFNFALLVTLRATPGIGPEFHFLAPGLAIIGLSRLLRRELGPTWTHRLFSFGATLVYATPVAGLNQGLTWGWLSCLLVLAVGFGALSFAVESRSLLVVSSGALAIDLGSYALKLHQTAPMLLWAAGAGFGIAIMAFAAWLEWRREGVLQQIRVFGQSLSAWS